MCSSAVRLLQVWMARVAIRESRQQAKENMVVRTRIYADATVALEVIVQPHTRKFGGCLGPVISARS